MLRNREILLNYKTEETFERKIPETKTKRENELTIHNEGVFF